jgi:gluconolactonase
MIQFAGFDCLVRGIPGAEGPLTTTDHRIYMVSPSRGEVLRIHQDGRSEIFANTSGKPAGLQLHCNGDIWVADMIQGILKVTPDGTVTPVVSHYEGKPIRGCNDLVFDSSGNLYFTAPAGSNGAPGGAVGEVFFHSAQGETTKLGGGFAFPNGIAIDASNSLLVFSETYTHKLLAWDLREPGKTANLRTWATLPNEGEKAGGDGMDFDAKGNLIATAYSRGTLEVYDGSGSHLKTIPLPFERCSNVHFFNNSSGHLLITEHENNALWIYDYGTPGQTQFGWRLPQHTK